MHGAGGGVVVVWVASALAAPGAVVDVSARRGEWAAVDAAGAVWRSTDGGGAWALGLGPVALPDQADGWIDGAEVGAEAPPAEGATAGPASAAYGAGGELVVARADGLWIERDGRWARALPEPATAVCQRPDGRWVVGTPAGVRTGTPGGAWSAVDVGPGAVRDVACGEVAAVAGEAGVWIEGAGEGWTRLPGPNDATAVAPGATWFAAAGRLWVSSSARTAPVAVLRLPNATGLVQIGGTWLAAGPAGAVASRDRGATWAARPDLPPGVTALTEADGALLVATPAGPSVAPLEAPRSADLGPPSPAVISALPAVPGGRSVRLARWMPGLEVVWTGRRDLSAPSPGASTGSAAGVRSGWWTVGAALTFVPPAPFDPELAPAGEVAPADGPGADLALAAAVTREASARRTRQVRAIRELLAARQVARGEVERAPTLVDRAQAALRVAELDARLRALGAAVPAEAP